MNQEGHSYMYLSTLSLSTADVGDYQSNQEDLHYLQENGLLILGKVCFHMHTYMYMYMYIHVKRHVYNNDNSYITCMSRLEG